MRLLSILDVQWVQVKKQFNGMVDVASDIAYANGVAIDSVLEMVKIYGNAGTTMEQMQAKLSVAAQFHIRSRRSTSNNFYASNYEPIQNGTRFC